MSRYIGTVSGRIVDLTDPRPDAVDPDDIAWHLSGIVRWVGATSVQITVAEHSLVVASLFDDPVEVLAALLHDAPEAYLGDITKPLKDLLPTYRELEELWMAAIWERLGCGQVYPAARVKRADLAVLAAEAERWADPTMLEVIRLNLGGRTIEPAPVAPEGLDQQNAYALFLDALTRARAAVEALAPAEVG